MRVARQSRFHRILGMGISLRNGLLLKGAMRVARQSRFHRILGLGISLQTVRFLSRCALDSVVWP
jgi:hypothetical protein